MSSLICVCTTRAGQTSTSFAVSLAWTVAASRDVLLLDLDMEGGTIADLLLLRTGDRGIGSCLVERRLSANDLDAQAVDVPDRPRLRVVPGLRGTYGVETGEALRQLTPALAALPAALVVADVGNPLAHPGLRSPRAVGETLGALFERVLVVIRDEPALLARSIEVLRAARLPHGELVICRQRSRAHRVLVEQTIEAELPDLPVRDGWEWDERRAQRMADTGRPLQIDSMVEALHI
jgi:MinD-like ATPase involved in chromosome partitioning or flagellar assembly